MGPGASCTATAGAYWRALKPRGTTEVRPSIRRVRRHDPRTHQTSAASTLSSGPHQISRISDSVNSDPLISLEPGRNSGPRPSTNQRSDEPGRFTTARGYRRGASERRGSRETTIPIRTRGQPFCASRRVSCGGKPLSTGTLHPQRLKYAEVPPPRGSS